MVKIDQEDDGQKGRFILLVDGVEAGNMFYTREGRDVINIEHTEVKEEFGGKGYAKQLVMSGVAYARSHKIKIIPSCPYAKHVFSKDESLKDLLA